MTWHLQIPIFSLWVLYLFTSAFLLLDSGYANNHYLNNLICLHSSSLSTFSQLLPDNLEIFSVNFSQGHSCATSKVNLGYRQLEPLGQRLLWQPVWSCSFCAGPLSRSFWLTFITQELWLDFFQTETSACRDSVWTCPYLNS